MDQLESHDRLKIWKQKRQKLNIADTNLLILEHLPYMVVVVVLHESFTCGEINFWSVITVYSVSGDTYVLLPYVLSNNSNQNEKFIQSI